MHLFCEIGIQQSFQLIISSSRHISVLHFYEQVLLVSISRFIIEGFNSNVESFPCTIGDKARMIYIYVEYCKCNIVKGIVDFRGALFKRRLALILD